MQSLNDFMGFIVLGITVVVMAVPEGLPMAVVISLAYSVEKMRQLNNLVRDMSACETMGNVTDVCSDKTGTLTENVMTVIDVYYGGNFVSVTSTLNEKLKKDPDLLELCNAVAINSTATPDFSKPLRDQTGNKTEMALMDFCKSAGIFYDKVRTLDKIQKMLPFSSERKQMLTLFLTDSKVRYLYVKGAPEVVLQQCNFYRQDSKTFRIEKEWRDNIEKNILRLLGEKKARAIAVARVEVEKYTEGDDITKLSNNMTFLGIFGIMDPVRTDVPNAVATAQRAGVTVRMVTGDNTQIGAAIAKECGIIPKDWQPKQDDYAVLDGKQFRELVGELQWRDEEVEDKDNDKDDDNKKEGEKKPPKMKKIRVPYVRDMHTFSKIEPSLRVIGRCLPTDKLLLVTGLQTLDRVVAVTGDGANDAPALKKADVGLGMGKTGTDMCKDASKIVLLDDNFASIITAIKYVNFGADLKGKKHFRGDQKVHQVPTDREFGSDGNCNLLRIRD